MENKEILRLALDELMNNGAEKAVVYLNESEIQEFVHEGGKINLFRTTKQKRLNMKAIIDFKKNDQSLNQLDVENIKQKAKEVVDSARNSEPDTANDIADIQTQADFKKGIDKPEIDKIYQRMVEFTDYVKVHFPKLIIEQFIVKYIHSKFYFMDSKGNDLLNEHGGYSIFPMFTSKDGKDTSSFNYCAVETDNLDQPFIELGRFAVLMKESTEQTKTRSVPDNFIGEIIITPECFEDFLYFFSSMIGTYPLITDTCLFKDKIDCKIASEKFTLHSKPISEEFVSSDFFNMDGYLMSNYTYIQNGVFKSFILGLYGSKKTGLPRSANDGFYWDVEAGNQSLEEMIKSVKKGIVLSRFSGGRPSENGDFSGVAKNSYYIEDGKVQYPVNETMISGNIAQMLLDITDISKERINFGSTILPWIKFDKINISGK